MGWYGFPQAKNKNDLVKIIEEDYRKNNSFLDSAIRHDHFWILYKTPKITSCDCYFVDYNDGQYMVKPISCESGPVHHDIPRDWLKKITSNEDRIKINPHNENSYFNDWIKEVEKQRNRGMEL